MNATLKSITANVAKLDTATLAKVEAFLVALVAQQRAKTQPAKGSQKARRVLISESMSDTILLTLAKVCGFDEVRKYAKIWDAAFATGFTQTAPLSAAHKRMIVNGLKSIDVTHAKIESGDNGLIFPIFKR